MKLKGKGVASFFEQLAKTDLLICDTWGYVSLEQAGSEFLFRATSDCRGQPSILRPKGFMASLCLGRQCLKTWIGVVGLCKTSWLLVLPYMDSVVWSEATRMSLARTRSASWRNGSTDSWSVAMGSAGRQRYGWGKPDKVWDRCLQRTETGK